MFGRTLRSANQLRGLQAVRASGAVFRPLPAVNSFRNFHTSAARQSAQASEEDTVDPEAFFQEGDWARERPTGVKYWFTALAAYGGIGAALGLGMNYWFLSTFDSEVSPLVSMEELERLDKAEREKYQTYLVEMLQYYAEEDRKILEAKLAAKAEDRKARRSRLKAQGSPLVADQKP